MSKYLPQILVGVAVAFVLGLIFRLLLGPGLNYTIYAGFIGAFVAYILANLAGNRKVPVATAAERDAALDFQAPAGRALVYLFREGYVGKAAGMNVSVDGREVAQLKSPRFTRLVLSPGAHALAAGFAGFAGAQSKAAAYDLVVAEGDVTVLKLGAAMGLVQGAVTFTPQADLAAARTRLSRMTMVPADPAEI